MKREGEESLVFWLLNFGIVASFLILLAAMLRLSVIRGKFYQTQARDNRVYETIVPAGRGEIVDRKGRVVAQSLYFYFKKDGEDKIYQGLGNFEGYKFEGKDLAYDLKRKYPYGESMAFVSGYVGKVNESELRNNKCEVRLDPSEVVGRGGVEEVLDCELRGVDGRRLIEVDARGKYVRELGRDEPELGKTIELSMDAFWQEKIYKILDGRKAVVIISDPRTGKIINLVSSPAFDPNNFSYEQDNLMIESYLGDSENMPLLNRAISGRYHPGSTFKLTMATAGLESGMIEPVTTIEDTGIIKVGDYSYSNWLWTKRGGTDGMVDMVKALKRSNDIYFYRLGERLGVDRIKEWSEKFGYGSKTGVELTGELSGVVPDEKWKKETKGENWYLGNTYHLSIGQGDLSVTPLQVNQMTNVVANNGVRCNMSVLKNSPSKCTDLHLEGETLETVITGMKQACKEGGTAWPLFNFKTQIACKTGTAEVGDGSKDTHAWLTAFAPVENPQISITVLVERGGEGSDVAAPIVGDILKEWFEEPDTIVPRLKEE